MVTNFFDIPLELREKIYFELLVVPDTIVVPLDPPGRKKWLRKRGLCPEILRVNKKTYREARQLLYSNNRFKITYAEPAPEHPEHPLIAAFLSQIRSQAGLIRHICIDYPFSGFNQPGEPGYYPGQLRDLHLVGGSCPNIRVLELSLRPSHNWILDLLLAAETLDMVDEVIRGTLKPTKIIVRGQLAGESDLRKIATRMCGHGWVVEVTKRKPPEANF